MIRVPHPRALLARGPAWLKGLVLVVAGLLSALSLPPLYLFPVLLLALPVLLWRLEGCTRARSAFATGWLFGLGHFGGGLYWIGESFLVDVERTGFLMPFAVAGVATGFALFTGCLGLFYHRLAVKSGWNGLAVFTGLWLFFEWLRSWLLTGFPWNYLGTVFAFSPDMMQGAALGGVWLLTLAALLFALAPVQVFSPSRFARPLAAVFLALPLIMWGAGALRLAGAPALSDSEGPLLRLVQPNIAQADKWGPDRSSHVETQILLSQTVSEQRPDLVLWAETAVPYVLSGEPALQAALSRALMGHGHLVTGALRSGPDREGLYNTLFVLDPLGDFVATYDKTHLVPFGEYVPLRSFGLGGLAAGQGDFAFGAERPLLEIGVLPPAVPLICYEVIFPGALYPDSPRPAWLLNITNDAWFGSSSGPYQHFAAARLRAVEEGLPLVRVANTGISAVVDPYGRLLGYLGLGERGIVDAVLPPALGPTPFARLAGFVPPFLFFLLLGIGWATKTRRV